MSKLQLAVFSLVLAVFTVASFAVADVRAVAGGDAAVPSSSSAPSIANSMGLRRDAPTFNGMSSYRDGDTIFVALAAFRDKLCHLTVSHIFKTARNPRRIFLGIIEQNEPGDQICSPMDFFNCRSDEFCPLDNVKRRRVVSRRGKGPTYGRYVAFLMYRGEVYAGSLDSHSQFVHHWDQLTLAQLHRSRSSRPLISHYPNGWDNNGYQFESTGNVIVMCNAHYVSMGYVRMDGRWMNRAIEPRVQPFSAAGYLFADAALFHECPFDPHLDYIFDGEEILFSVRAWTHGWDIFTPEQSTLFHNYNRHKHLGYYRHWDVQNDIPNNHGWHKEVDISQMRAQLMMEIPKENTTELLVNRHDKSLHPRVLLDFERYSIGRRRSMAEYNWFAQIDPVRRKASDDLCKKLEVETIQKSAK